MEHTFDIPRLIYVPFIQFSSNFFFGCSSCLLLTAAAGVVLNADPSSYFLVLLCCLSAGHSRQFHISPVLEVKIFGVSMGLLLLTFCSCFPIFTFSGFHLIFLRCFLFEHTDGGLSGLSLVLECRLS
jgi:hypothetical protein